MQGNHHRKRLRDLVKDVEHYLQANGPWKYKRPQLYDDPEVTAEIVRLVAQQKPRAAA
jgi:hypothetical protein